MKRSVSFLAVIFGLMPLVSAISLREGMYQVFEHIEDIGTPIFEVLLKTDSGEFFFAKILLLLLLYVVIFTVLKKTPLFESNKMITFIVSAAVSILAVRYIPSNDFFSAILIPYGTLGVSISVFLPFLIYFFFVHNSVPGTFGRRAAWALFGIVFLVLWGFRVFEKGLESTIYGNTIYFIGIVFILLAFFFDRSLHKYFGMYQISASKSKISDAQRVKLLDEYQKSLSVYNETKDPAAKRRMKRLAKQLNITAGEEP